VDIREQVFDQLRGKLEAAVSSEAKAKGIAEAIRDSGAYRWAGIYEINGEEIAAIAWTGGDPPAFPRFPMTQGLCGDAVRARTTVVAGDVAKDPRYLTTFGTTQSEIVVPIFSRGSQTALGLIDVESERLNAFGDADRAFLEDCAMLAAGLWE
jgi:GAF domain-containing protein